MIKIIEVLPTPNPLAKKFLCDKVIVQNFSKSFPNREKASENEAATALFNISDVQSVFMLENAVTVNISNPDRWESLIPEIAFLLEEHLEEDPAIKKLKDQLDLNSSADFFKNLSDVEKLKVLEKVLDEAVRPALAGDGGGLSLLGIHGNTVEIKYLGACGSCPAATGSTLTFIQQVLHDGIDPDLQLEMK